MGGFLGPFPTDCVEKVGRPNLRPHFRQRSCRDKPDEGRAHPFGQSMRRVMPRQSGAAAFFNRIHPYRTSRWSASARRQERPLLGGEEITASDRRRPFPASALRGLATLDSSTERRYKSGTVAFPHCKCFERHCQTKLSAACNWRFGKPKTPTKMTSAAKSSSEFSS